MKTSSRVLCYLGIIVSVMCIFGVTEAQTADKDVVIDVGVILNLDNWIGRMTQSCISMALEDYYSAHNSSATRLVLHTRDARQDIVDAASSVPLDSFQGLFGIAGVVSAFALIVSLCIFLYEHRDILAREDPIAQKLAALGRRFDEWQGEDSISQRLDALALRFDELIDGRDNPDVPNVGGDNGAPEDDTNVGGDNGAPEDDTNGPLELELRDFPRSSNGESSTPNNNSPVAPEITSAND